MESVKFRLKYGKYVIKQRYLYTYTFKLLSIYVMLEYNGVTERYHLEINKKIRIWIEENWIHQFIHDVRCAIENYDIVIINPNFKITRFMEDDKIINIINNWKDYEREENTFIQCPKLFLEVLDDFERFIEQMK